MQKSDNIEYYKNLSLDVIDNEQWKSISDINGYMVSSFGRIMSLKQDGRRIMKQMFRGNYLQICLCENNVKKIIPTHKLVARAFLNHDVSGKKIVVDHINNTKTDNRLVNLQVASARINLSKDRKGGTSNYPGVSRVKTNKVGVYKWQSKIFHEKPIYLGLFDTEKEAYSYYKKALHAIKMGTEIETKRKEYSSQYRDVYYSRSLNKWVANKTINRKSKYIGLFETEIDAYNATLNYV